MAHVRGMRLQNSSKEMEGKEGLAGLPGREHVGIVPVSKQLSLQSPPSPQAPAPSHQLWLPQKTPLPCQSWGVKPRHFDFTPEGTSCVSSPISTLPPPSPHGQLHPPSPPPPIILVPSCPPHSHLWESVSPW